MVERRPPPSANTALTARLLWRPDNRRNRLEAGLNAAVFTYQPPVNTGGRRRVGLKPTDSGGGIPHRSSSAAQSSLLWQVLGRVWPVIILTDIDLRLGVGNAQIGAAGPSRGALPAIPKPSPPQRVEIIEGQRGL